MNEKFVDYYKVLDIDINASVEIIRMAYLQLAKKNHPDQGGNAEKFQLICEAYECLYNKNSRKSYDLKYLKKNYDDLKEDEFIKFRSEFKEFEQMNKKSLSKDELDNLTKQLQPQPQPQPSTHAYGTTSIDIKQRLNDISIERDNQDIELKDDSIKNVLELNNLDINDIYEYSLGLEHSTFTEEGSNDNTNIINLGTIDLLCSNLNTNYSLITDCTEGNSNSLYTCIDEFDATDTNKIDKTDTNKINKINMINKIDKLKEWKINKKATSKLTSDKIEEYIMNRKKEEEEIIKNFDCITKKISK
jgi:curved DNA-binding protein CbpA